MANLRAWLTNCGFVPNLGHHWILYQSPVDDEQRYGALNSPEPIEWDHPILDKEFDSGYGSAEAPHILAGDYDALYIIGQYDGATWMQRVPFKLSEYIVDDAALPYIGGG